MQRWARRHSSSQALALRCRIVWTCTTYDTRSRATSTTYPAFGGNPARTVTSNYAVSSNPLVTSVTDPGGTITSTIDLIGRPVSTTDVWGLGTVNYYDAVGRQVRSLVSGTQTAGTHAIEWDGRNDSGSILPAGVYLYRLETEDVTSERKMLRMK